MIKIAVRWILWLKNNFLFVMKIVRQLFDHTTLFLNFDRTNKTERRHIKIATDWPRIILLKHFEQKEQCPTDPLILLNVMTNWKYFRTVLQRWNPRRRNWQPNARKCLKAEYASKENLCKNCWSKYRHDKENGLVPPLRENW